MERDESREVVFMVDFLTEKADLNNYAVEVLPYSPNKAKLTRLCGFVRSVDREKHLVTCSFSTELLRLFHDCRIDGSGTLECSYVDTNTQRQVRALDQFRNISFFQGKSSEDREAFRNLRRVLLGLRLAPTVATSTHAT